jgi:hypothetical protein
VVKVADFGLAKVLGTESHPQLDPELTVTGSAMGTPDYMAPEQREGGSVDHRADIYALGVMIYELLTGVPPRGAWSVPSQKVEIDVRLDEIVIKALQENPVARYQAAGEVQQDVDSVKSSTGGEPIPVGAAVEPLPSTRKNSGIAKPRTAPSEHPPSVAQNQEPVQNVPSMDAIVETTKSRHLTMLLLGAFAVLTLGAIAIYVGVFIDSEKMPEMSEDDQEQAEIRKRLKKAGVKIVDELPAPGQDGWIILFDGETIYGNPYFAKQGVSYANKELIFDLSWLKFQVNLKNYAIQTRAKMISGTNYAIGMAVSKEEKYKVWANGRSTSCGLGVMRNGRHISMLGLSNQPRLLDFTDLRYQIVQGIHKVYLEDELIGELNYGGPLELLNPSLRSTGGRSIFREIKIKRVKNPSENE